jgi:multidrug resistance protein MdtO
VEAARTALKATITTAVSATLQIIGPFGPLFAFVIGQPGISLGLSEGGLIIALTAVIQAAIVPITGKMLDYPGVIMAFLFVVFAFIAYLMANRRLFPVLALVVVGTITTVYAGIFEPGKIGWGSTYTFDGILAATLVMVVVDTLIWPSPPEPKLLESVAADLEHSRRRLQMVGTRYLDLAAAPLPATEVVSRLAPHLALLQLMEGLSTPQRFARLLNAVMVSDRVFLEVERLALLAEEPLPGDLALLYRDRLDVALSGIDADLTRRKEELLEGFPDEMSPARGGAELKELSMMISQDGTPTDIGASNLAGFVGALEIIENLLETPAVGTFEASGSDDLVEPRPLIDQGRFRFSVKFGVTMVLGLLVGLTTQRANLQTILWSIAVAAGPNEYGGVIRKSFLRLAGCVVGGLATLAAMVLVSQNFDSLPPYVIAIFAVTLLSTYVAQSSDWLNYAGKQVGVTFLICYVGMGPSTDVYTPLWRFWGIVLGVVTTGFVYLLLWPEYASDKLIDSLAKLMRTSLAFGREVAEGTITEGRIAAMEQRLSTNLLETLNFADQARVEGQHGRDNSRSGVDAASTVIRIAYRFEVIARARLSGAEAFLPRDVAQVCSVREGEYCNALESRIEWLESTKSAERAAWLPPRAEVDVAALYPATTAFFEGRDLAAQLESYRRLPILLEHLDRALSRIAAS